MSFEAIIPFYPEGVFRPLNKQWTVTNTYGMLYNMKSEPDQWKAAVPCNVSINDCTTRGYIGSNLEFTAAGKDFRNDIFIPAFNRLTDTPVPNTITGLIRLVILDHLLYLFRAGTFRKLLPIDLRARHLSVLEQINSRLLVDYDFTYKTEIDILDKLHNLYNTGRTISDDITVMAKMGRFEQYPPHHLDLADGIVWRMQSTEQCGVEY